MKNPIVRTGALITVQEKTNCDWLFQMSEISTYRFPSTPRTTYGRVVLAGSSRSMAAKYGVS